jgi:hypothetical protein
LETALCGGNSIRTHREFREKVDAGTVGNDLTREIGLLTGDCDLGVGNGGTARIMNGPLYRTTKRLSVEPPGVEGGSQEKTYNNSEHHKPSSW